MGLVQLGACVDPPRAALEEEALIVHADGDDPLIAAAAVPDPLALVANRSDWRQRLKCFDERLQLARPDLDRIPIADYDEAEVVGSDLNGKGEVFNDGAPVATHSSGCTDADAYRARRLPSSEHTSHFDPTPYNLG